MGGFLASPTSGMPSGGGIAQEPIQGDSLTRYVRSIQNLTGAQGQGILGQGLSDVQGGLTAAQPALQLLTQLTKGNWGDISTAMQPEVDQITQQFDQIRNMVSMQPRGGGKATALAEAPFQKAGAIQRAAGEARMGAVGQLGNLATNLAGIGLGEANLGQSLESLGANIAMQRRGQNIQQDMANQKMMSDLGMGIGQLIGSGGLSSIAGGLGGLLGMGGGAAAGEAGSAAMDALPALLGAIF